MWKEATTINPFILLEKPLLDDCYICLEAIGNQIETSAVFPYKCRHPICITCLIAHFQKISLCGICRKEPSRYIVNSPHLSLATYSRKQSLYVPRHTLTNETQYRDHIQHMIANYNSK
jgi:hypothetical protein